jgi:hypothetical protein
MGLPRTIAESATKAAIMIANSRLCPPILSGAAPAGFGEELKRPPGNIQRPPGLEIACF